MSNNLMPISETLLNEIIGKLETDCENGFDRLTDNYIIPKGTYTYDEEMEKGDRWAWKLLQQIKKEAKLGDDENV